VRGKEPACCFPVFALNLRKSTSAGKKKKERKEKERRKKGNALLFLPSTFRNP